MRKTEFGKDLGLMHEVIVTGRKAGFGRDEWAKAAHSEELMREILNLTRGYKETQLPPGLDVDSQIAALADFFRLILPFTYKDRTCIACYGEGGPNSDENRRLCRKNAELLSKGYEQLKIIIGESDQESLQHGRCYQPITTFHRLLKEVLGIEAPEDESSPNNSGDWKMFGWRTPEGCYILRAVVVSPTSPLRIMAFKKILKDRHLNLKVELLLDPKE